MPHLINGDRIVGRFEVPWRGVNRQVPAHMLKPDELRDSRNVFPRRGVFRQRAGYAVFDAGAATFTGTPTGIFPYLRGSADPVPIVATTSRIYAYDSGAWADKTGTPPTAATTQPARFTTMALGSPPVNYIIHSNGKDAPAQWNGVAGTFTAVAGTPPLWSDLCTIQDHVIGIVPPYAVQWGPIRSISSWPALNTKLAAETVDAVVAIRPLGNGSAAVLYKESSLWPVVYTGQQTEATAFRIGPDPLGFWEGPASPAAVVTANGAHFYLTVTGRLAFFTGSQHIWIGDGALDLIQADLDTTKASRIWGVYDPRFQEIHFVYPSLSVSSQMRGYIGLSLPKPDQGITVFGVFPGLLSTELSSGASIKLTDRLDRTLTAGAKSYEFSMTSTTDGGTTGTNGTAFSGYWQTGLVGMPGLDPLRLEATETFAERGNGYGKLDLKLVNSWVMANEGNVEATARSVDLGQTTEPSKAPVGADIQGRFFGQRYEFSDSGAVTIRVKGSTLVALKKA